MVNCVQIPVHAELAEALSLFLRVLFLVPTIRRTPLFGRLALLQIGAQRLGEAAGAFGVILAHFMPIWRDALDPSIAFVHRRASSRISGAPDRLINGRAAVAQW